MRMFNNRLENRRGALLAIGTERMRALVDAPAVVSAAFDSVDRFPQILADLAGPEVAGLPVEAELPRLPKPVRPQLRPCACRPGEGIVLRNAVISAWIWI